MQGPRVAGRGLAVLGGVAARVVRIHRVVLYTGLGSSFPPSGVRSLDGGRGRAVSRWTSHSPARNPSVCLTTLMGSSWGGGCFTGPFLDVTKGTGERPERRLPQRKWGQPFSLCQGFGLGAPRKGVGLEVGLTAASQDRENYTTQQGTTVIAILVH